MLHLQNQSTEYDEKLPIEYPLRKALGIYLKRLKTFFIVVAINILIFLLFVGVQHLSVKFVYLLNINMMVILFSAFIFFMFVFSFAYSRSNPVKGYLVFSDETKEIYTINLYTGWRITKKKLNRYVSPRWGIDVLIAKNIRHQEHTNFGESSRIHIQLKYKYPKMVIEEDIEDGETKFLPDGIIVSYQHKTG